MNYTQGKWVAQDDAIWLDNHKSPAGFSDLTALTTMIAYVPKDMGIPAKEREANMKLITLSPKMLKALQGLMELEFDTDNEDYEALKPVLDMASDVVAEVERT